MFTPLQTARTNRWITGSLAAHALVLTAFLAHRKPLLTEAERPGSPHGHDMLLTYMPGSMSAAVSSPLQTTHPAAIKSPVHAAKPTPTAAAAAQLAPSSGPSTSTATGNDALGAGDVTLALVDVHPPPHPDLGQLAKGTHGDVVVDIVIDPLGRISQSTLVRGLGPGIDQTVLATIQGWTFHPATRNGVPVASEQELLFHYDRG